MKEIIRGLKFIVITAAAFIVCYFCFTTNGIDFIYSGLLDFNSRSIDEIEVIIDSKDDSETIRTSKMILLGMTGDTNTDVVIQETLLDYLSNKTDANCIIADITNSEAGLLNAYFSDGNENYYNTLKTSTESELLRSEQFLNLIRMLYEKSQMRAESDRYYWAGIAPDTNEEAQLGYLRYLLNVTAENPLNAAIAPYLESDEKTAAELASGINEGIAAHTGMFKEHFLALFGKLEYAVKCICEPEKNRNRADNFLSIYRDRIAGKYIVMLDENMINPNCIGNGFISYVYDEIPLLKKRTYMINAFICGADLNNIRIVNSERMKYADSYAGFIYSLAGKLFLPTPYETAKYYVRVG